MDTSPEMARKLEALYREKLESKFRGVLLKFDPILVEAVLDQFGEDTFHVTVVYDGEQELLDYAKLNRISGEVWLLLRGLGVDEVPIESYVDMKEYSIRDELLGPEPWEEDPDWTGAI